MTTPQIGRVPNTLEACAAGRFSEFAGGESRHREHQTNVSVGLSIILFAKYTPRWGRNFLRRRLLERPNH